MQSSTDNRPVITFWHFWSEPNQKKALTRIINEFEKKYNCKVETTELSWANGKVKLMSAFNSETEPDVLELGSDWVAQFSSANVLLNLSFEKISLTHTLSASREPAFWNDSAYALPWIVDTRLLFRNLDVLQKFTGNTSAPQSLEALLTEARKVYTNSNHQIAGWGANGSDAHRLYKKIIPFFWMRGGIVLDKSGTPSLARIENIHGLQDYCALSETGFIETQKAIDDAFLQGKVAFVYTGSWLISKLLKSGIHFDVSLLPAPEGKSSCSFAGGEYVAISKRTKNKELSKLFAQFITSKEQTIAFCTDVREAGFPADSLGSLDASFAEVPFKKAFAQQLLFSKMTPVHPRWLDLEALIEEATAEALYKRKSPEQALRDAQTKALMLMQEP